MQEPCKKGVSVSLVVVGDGKDLAISLLAHLLRHRGGGNLGLHRRGQRLISAKADLRLAPRRLYDAGGVPLRHEVPHVLPFWACVVVACGGSGDDLRSLLERLLLASQHAARPR